VAEALVAAALAGLALALVATGARLAGSGLRLARDASASLALAETQLETLRLAPGEDGSDDVTTDGVTFSRAWTVAGGRGRPMRVAVEVTWDTHRFALESGTLR
jgi:type II secretory pathway pseudopilin PulG